MRAFGFSTLAVILAMLNGLSTAVPYSGAAPYKFADVPVSNFNVSCAALVKSISIENVTVNFADFVPSGTNLTFPDSDPTCTRPFQVVFVDLCRVNMNVSTSNMSGIILEAWLPKNWTGRFLSTGNGGLGGCRFLVYSICAGLRLICS